MVEAAAIGSKDEVLDIGGATGYSAAVLSCLARSVVALDQDTDVLKSAQSDWTSLGLTSISPVVGPHIWGAAGQGPFDVIFINGAVPRVPEALSDQLAAGGRLVCLLVPEGDAVGALVCFTKLANGQIVHEVVADAVNRDYLADPSNGQRRQVEVNRGSNFKYGMRADLVRQAALSLGQRLP